MASTQHITKITSVECDWRKEDPCPSLLPGKTDSKRALSMFWRAGQSQLRPGYISPAHFLLIASGGANIQYTIRKHQHRLMSLLLFPYTS